MTLDNLLGLSMEASVPDAGAIARLLASASSSLADARLGTLSHEGRFDMAYKAIMQSANAVGSRRKRRNALDYSGDLISPSRVDQAVAHAEALHARVRASIREARPDWAIS